MKSRLCLFFYVFLIIGLAPLPFSLAGVQQQPVGIKISIPETGWRLWTTEGILACSNQNQKSYIDVIADNEGGAIFTWNDWPAADVHIGAQKLNSAGQAAWGREGKVVCGLASRQMYAGLVSDFQGGAIIVWLDRRAGNDDIYLQRISRAGDFLWDQDGVAVCTSSGQQISDGAIISDGAGGAIVAWRDQHSGKDAVYVQRINSNGQKLWGNGVCLKEMNLDIDKTWWWVPRIASDEQGGVIGVWDERAGGSDYNVFANRVNADGKVLWGANGIAVIQALGDQKYAHLVSDGTGGAVVIWMDKRDTDFDLYAQHIDSEGNVLWPGNGTVVSAAAGDQEYQSSTSDGAGGAIVAWGDGRDGISKRAYGQRINDKGKLLWGNDGLALNAAGECYYAVYPISDNDGGAVILWSDDRNGKDYDCYAQWVDRSGKTVWQEGGVSVFQRPGNQFSAQGVFDGNGGLIVAILDVSESNFWDIYAQRLAVGSLDLLKFPQNRIYYSGDKVKIEWESKYFTSINLEYSLDNGDSWETIAQNIPAVNKSYFWTIPNQETEEGLVRIVVPGWPEANVASGDNFCIASGDKTSPSELTAETVQYFAEGCTRAGFETWLTLVNYGAGDEQVIITCMDPRGNEEEDIVTVPAESRVSVLVNDIVNNSDLSLKVAGSGTVAAERSVYWRDNQGRIAGGSCGRGVVELSSSWMFAEGCTRDGFETWLTMFNPGFDSAQVIISYIGDGGIITQETILVSARSRRTVAVNETVSGADVALKIESSVPIAVERVMYWQGREGGHVSSGMAD